MVRLTRFAPSSSEMLKESEASRLRDQSRGLPPVTLCVIHYESCPLLSRRSERINVACWRTLAEVAAGLTGAPWTAQE